VRTIVSYMCAWNPIKYSSAGATYLKEKNVIGYINRTKKGGLDLFHYYMRIAIEMRIDM